MHTQKNVCVNILKLLLEDNDSKAMPMDLKDMNHKKELWLGNEKVAPTQKDPFCKRKKYIHRESKSITIFLLILDQILVIILEEKMIMNCNI